MMIGEPAGEHRGGAANTAWKYVTTSQRKTLSMNKDAIKSIRARIRGLRTQLNAAKQQGLAKQAELIAGALEAEEAKLSKLLGSSRRRQ